MSHFAGDMNLAVQTLEKRDFHLRARDRALRLKRAVEGYLRDVDEELGQCALAARMVGMSLPELDWRNVLAVGLEQEVQRVDRTIGALPEETGLERQRAYWALADELLRRIDNIETPKPQPARKQTLIQFVRDMLRDAGGQGVRSAAIRDAAAERFEKRFHPKTVGMMLNRLLHEGLARREGRTWFSAATKNPSIVDILQEEPVIRIGARDEVVEDSGEMEVRPAEDLRYLEARSLLIRRRQSRR
jgi:hypothetical protein